MPNFLAVTEGCAGILLPGKQGSLEEVIVVASMFPGTIWIQINGQ